MGGSTDDIINFIMVDQRRKIDWAGKEKIKNKMETNIFRNAKVGDFFGISPTGSLKGTRYFVISDIDQVDGDNKVIYIHPGSRTECLYKLQIEDVDRPWMLTFESLDSTGITSWGDGTSRIGPLEIDMYECQFLEASKPLITGFGMTRRTFTDYRITRQIITDFATNREYQGKKKGIKKSMYLGMATKGNYHPTHIRSYTKLGAVVSFMNWIESMNYRFGSDEDVFMWDQIDPIQYSLERYDSVENMIKNFEHATERFVLHIESPVEFPGPLPTSYRTKPARD